MHCGMNSLVVMISCLARCLEYHNKIDCRFAAMADAYS